MSIERKSTSFKQEWWDDIETYLKNNPQEGFEPEEVKVFIKNVLNRYMADDTSIYTREEILMLKDMAEESDQ